MSTGAVTRLLEAADAQAVGTDWPGAFRTLQEACAIDPSDPHVLVRLGSYLLRYGFAPREWLPMFEQAAERAPDSADILAQAGLARAIVGKFPDAEAALRRALRSPEAPAMAATLLALLQVQQDRRAEGKSLLEAAIRRFPHDLHARNILAQVLELEGSYDAARSRYGEILSVDARHAGAALALRRMALREERGDSHAPPVKASVRSAVMLVDDRRIDRRVLDEARSLREAGWDVTVVAGDAPEENGFWDEECYPDISIIRANERMLSLPCYGNRFRYTVPWYHGKASAVLRGELLSRILPKPEWRQFLHERRGFYIIAADFPASVYVAHDLPQVPAAAMAAAVHGGRLVYDSHELYPEQSFVLKDKPLLEAMERHLAPMADQVIVVNESMAAEMAARYGVQSDVILNCPSLDPSAFPVPRTGRLAESLGLTAGRRILLYQGNIVAKIRNLENIIGAMALVAAADVVLVLMGQDNGGGNDLVRLARAKGLLNRSVFFHPSVRQDELLSFTASAEVGLIPYTPVDWNTKYCTPNKLYEFIVAELPILANDLPELSRFVAGQEIGLNLPMGDAPAIARAIDRMFGADIDLFRKRLRDVSPRFLWRNHEGPAVVGIYERLIERNADVRNHRDR